MKQLNKSFFDSVRASLFNNQLTAGQVNSLNEIFSAWHEVDNKDIRLLAYSLATAYHEVGPGLTPISENLNYSAKRIVEVWPTRFKTLAAATPYANNPEKLANNVYGGRLGNNLTGDGYKYRGRGYPQTTGKENYQRFSNLFGVDLVKNPDLALQPKIAAKILILGIRDGLFTGKKFSTYNTYVKARPTVNADSTRKTKSGTSTIAKDIAEYADKFEKALQNGISETAVITKPKEEVKEKNWLSALIELIVKMLGGKK